MVPSVHQKPKERHNLNTTAATAFSPLQTLLVLQFLELKSDPCFVSSHLLQYQNRAHGTRIEIDRYTKIGSSWRWMWRSCGIPFAGCSDLMGARQHFYFDEALWSLSKEGCLRISFAEGRLTGSGSIIDWNQTATERVRLFFSRVTWHATKKCFCAMDVGVCC